MSTETVWGNQKPRDTAMLAIDPDTEIPGTLQDPDRAMVIVGDIYHSDAMKIPGHTPAFDRAGLHPLAGKRVRVSRAFRSLDPRHPDSGLLAVHLWAAEGDIGIAETPNGFIVYQASSLPDWWPKTDDVKRS